MSADKRDGLRLLVIDDNEDAANMLSLLLRVRGHRVDTGYDGEDGHQRLVEHEYDVAFLDVGLPQVDGYQLAERTRRAGASKDAMLVAVTGYGDRDKALRAGFDEHVVKPMTLERLDELLERVEATRQAG